MQPGGSYKKCPVCGQMQPAEVPQCQGCGHAFRTPYATPPDPTQFFHAQPGLAQYPRPAFGQPDTNKLVITLLLWFFVGEFGVHRFYLGHTQTGIIMLLLGVVGIATSCILVGLIPLAIVGVWWIVDVILIVTGQLQPTDGSRII